MKLNANLLWTDLGLYELGKQPIEAWVYDLFWRFCSELKALLRNICSFSTMMYFCILEWFDPLAYGCTGRPCWLCTTPAVPQGLRRWCDNGLPDPTACSRPLRQCEHCQTSPGQEVWPKQQSSCKSAFSELHISQNGIIGKQLNFMAQFSSMYSF